MILDDKVKIRVNSRTVKYYQEKGYEIPMKMGSHNKMVFDTSKYIEVNIADVDTQSTVIVNTICDVCKTPKKMPYREYYRQLDENGLRTCTKCKNIKSVKTNIARYGVSNPSQSEQIKEKVKNTMNERYGVDWAMESKEMQKKRKNTYLEKYGYEWATQNKDIRNKTINTNIEKYGYENPMQSIVVKEKLKNSMTNKYGFDNSMKVPEIKQKIKDTNIKIYGSVSPFGSIEVIQKSLNTKYKNGSVATSKQQLHICNLYKGLLNYPCSKYSLDIVVDNIDIEYDGKGHNLSVKLNNISNDKFNINQIIRDKIVKEHGYKILRIISNTDKLPSDEILLNILDYSKSYFNKSKHNWIEWYLDENKFRNFENMNGTFYDFGELYSVKSA